MIKYNQMKLLKNSAKYINRLRKIQASQPFEEYPMSDLEYKYLKKIKIKSDDNKKIKK
tara:strand:+ start:825 stop:998 length:174 start_codon:yes stop_codon:yes gene_type:complete